MDESFDDHDGCLFPRLFLFSEQRFLTHMHTCKPMPTAYLRIKHIPHWENGVGACYIHLICLQASLLLALFLSLCAYPSLSLSTSHCCSLLSDGAATCLGFDVSVCIVTVAMLPPTSSFSCIFLSTLIPCRSEPLKRS